MWGSRNRLPSVVVIPPPLFDWSFLIIFVFIIMNKRVNKYFDWKFEGSVLDTRPYGEDNDEWEGLWIGDEMVIGISLKDDNGTGTWFSNGQHFNGGNGYFDISYPDFNQAMTIYLNSKYPDIGIKKIY